ncbi:MAG: hypothetical protein U0401_16845 [Anaerolineae bacterium]
MLRILEIKAAASDTSIEVTDLSMRVCGERSLSQGEGGAPLPRCRAAAIMAPTTDVLFDFIGKVMCDIYPYLGESKAVARF